MAFVTCRYCDNLVTARKKENKQVACFQCKKEAQAEMSLSSIQLSILRLARERGSNWLYKNHKENYHQIVKYL